MAERREAKRDSSPRRSRVVVRVIVSAAALALVIVVVGVVSSILQAPPRSAVTVETTSTVPGQAAYEAALRALASGDTTAAAALLSEAAAAGNSAAAQTLATIASSSDSSVPTATVKPDAYSKATTDLASFLPRALTGYDMSGVETGTVSAIVSAQPTPSGPQSTVRVVAFTVLDKKSAAAATTWVADANKAYSHDVAVVTVGAMSGRFATDGSRLAVIVFARGRYAFEIAMTALQGDPASLKSLAIKAALALPATKVTP